MPDINNAINYEDTELSFIRNKLADATFTHSNWGDVDLETLRVKIRDFYRVEQNYLCSYCKENISTQSAMNSHVEHIVPKSKSRAFMFERKNLCTVCADCNEIKREKETRNIEEFPLARNYVRYPNVNAFKCFHPHYHIYEEHIFKCGDIYIDLSEKGSYTIHSCKLNRRVHIFGVTPEELSQTDFDNMLRGYLDEPNFARKKQIFNRIHRFFIKLGQT